jgi:hypothetical protein
MLLPGNPAVVQVQQHRGGPQNTGGRGVQRQVRHLDVVAPMIGINDMLCG